jgi:hypothetical protein
MLQGSFLRLVSLWWELPPWLDSNLRILNSGLQENSYDFLEKLLTSTPATRSNTLIVLHISSSA